MLSGRGVRLISLALGVTAIGSIGPAAAAGPCPAASAQARAWLDKSLTPECRADALIATLPNIDAKLAALAGSLQPFGITEANGPDGPAGPTRSPGPAASAPNPLTVAASFDTQLAARYGAMIGREFRAAGMRGMLGPTIDVARTWHFGRVPEGYGEDPLLSSEIAAAVVTATQKEGVAVTLKHFAGYTQEQGRTGDLPFGLKPAVDNIVSKRVMREIYLPPFRAAVQSGGALGIMCAFPRINGVYACENTWLLGILRNEWGFRGTVSPDFPDAQRSVVAAVNAGLDAGNFGLPRSFGPMPEPPPTVTPPGAPPGSAASPPGPPNLGAALGGGGVPGGVTLRQALDDGRIPVARLDDMIRRRLVRTFAVDSVTTPAGKLASPESLEQAIAVVEEGATLLRNERGLLPLSTTVKSLAIIGAQAGANPQVATAGSAFIESHRGVAVIDAIKARATGLSVGYAKGSLKLGALPTVTDAVLRTPDGAQGLRAEYFGNPDLRFSGTPLKTVVDSRIEQSGVTPVPELPEHNAWSVRWTGTLVPRATGTHTLSIAGAGSAHLYINDRRVAFYDRVDFGTVAYATLDLKAAQPVRLRVEYTPRESAPIPAMNMLGVTLGAKMHLGWSEPDTRIADAVALARKSDVAVVFAADNYGEGADRGTLSLPGDLDRLIAAVAAANPRTIVVLNTAGPVSMPWVKQVGAVLQLWYPGDALGPAVTRLLFGDASPGGRLPITFPRDETQGPVTRMRNYPGLTAADGSLDKAYFDEGLLTGYRWFDAKNQTPLFPFGHGLSYSNIEISNVKLDAGAAQPGVTATLRNRGTRSDSEVLQVYLGFPSNAGEPPKRLAAFTKVALAPGASQQVRIALPESAFEIWDDAGEHRMTPAGQYTVMVGRSSRDLVFKASLTRAARETTP